LYVYQRVHVNTLASNRRIIIDINFSGHMASHWGAFFVLSGDIKPGAEFSESTFGGKKHQE
jgi:hypothetical protein